MMPFGDHVWTDAPQCHPALRAGEVHVWRAAIDLSDERLAVLERSLGPDELARSARFRFGHGRRRFIARRGILRMLLGKYLAVPPGQVAYAGDVRGKLRLAAPLDGAGVCFSLAHSNRLALFAFALRREVGIDVESIRPLEDADAIAERHFTRSERMALAGVTGTARLELFFRYWARKEACVKATGEGLARPLTTFDVSYASEQPQFVPALAEAGTGSSWMLQDLASETEYAAALVVSGQDWRIQGLVCS